jgi:hypothetical protein
MKIPRSLVPNCNKNYFEHVWHFFPKDKIFSFIITLGTLATAMFPHILPLCNEPFASLDLANKVRTTLFSPTADSGTIGFQGTARDSRERNSMPTPMLNIISASTATIR